MSKIGEGTLLFLGFVALVLILATLGSWVVMLLVNGLFSAQFLIYVFGTAKLGFWQSWYLSVLISLLFKSSGNSSSSK